MNSHFPGFIVFYHFLKNKIKMSKFHVFDGYNQGVRRALGTVLNA